MKTLLHIKAAPRGEKSRTLQISDDFLDSFLLAHPGARVDTLDVFQETLPDVTPDILAVKYQLLSGAEVDDRIRTAWQDIIAHIERFLAADIYLVSCPMWNFSLPYRLKHYIDVILQPRYLFQYTESGVEGLAKGKKMFVVSTRGGDYGPQSPFHSFDHQEPYLRAVFGFAGITDITFITAQPMDALGTGIMKEKLNAARRLARDIAAEI